MYHHYCSQKSYDRDLIIVSIHRCINKHIKQLVVQSLSCVWLFATPWMQHTRLPCLPPSPRVCSNSCPLSRWCHPTISSCRPLLLLPSIFPSIRVFSNESALHIRWSQYWNFNISPSSEYSGLISFRIDWFDLLAVQGTLKSLLQHHNSEASILQHSVFFIVQLSQGFHTYLLRRSRSGLR